MKEEEKRMYEKRNLESEERYKINRQRVISEDEKFKRNTKEKEFKRFMSYFYLRKAKLNEIRNIKKREYEQEKSKKRKNNRNKER